MIGNVYMTGKIDDYVVDLMYPNVHFVLESGSEFVAPIYSKKMYEYCEDFGADKDTIKKIDDLYAEHMKMLREAPEGTTEHYAWHSIAVQQDLEGRMKLAEDLTKKIKVREEARAAVKKAEEAKAAAKSTEEVKTAEKKVEEARKEEEKKIEEARIAAKKVEEIRKEEEKKIKEAWLAKNAERAKKG